MAECSYCKKARAIHEDHIMPYRRKREEHAFFDTVPSCGPCNWAKLTRALVPVGYPRLEELRTLVPWKNWREWDGDPTSEAFKETGK